MGKIARTSYLLLTNQNEYMHNHYIINDEFEFHPASSTLRRLSEPGNVVVINSPAGRCLLLLIQKQDSVIGQQVFMDEVWKKCGIMVSTNTYYQNISILRKGLKKVGIEDELIVTIPRLGLTLANGTHVVKKVTPCAVKIDHENAEYIDEHALPDSFLPPASLTDPPAAATLVAPTLSRPYLAQEHKRETILLLATCAITAMLFSLPAIFWRDAEPVSYYQDFTQEITIDKCHIMIEPDNATFKKRQTMMNYIQPYMSNCDEFPWIYMDANPLRTRVSVIRCPAPVTEHRSCISDFFVEKL